MKCFALWLMLVSSSALAQSPDLTPKAASPATISEQAKQAATLPVDNGQDADFADRGFIATRTDPLIKAANGKLVWDLNAYAWMNSPAPATVNPSLWRHMALLRKHGLFKLSAGIWQVRGFDVSNMTVIAGDTGWILIDPLTTQETAAAALALVTEKLGARTVKAIIYTHSHGDHFGGVKGVTTADAVKSGAVTIIAPEHFLAEATSENVIAGTAMNRRANYQFGSSLTPGPQGQMGSGIGAAISAGAITLIAPTDTIRTTGETRMIDGVTLSFQMVPETEAPAELNVMIPQRKTLLIGELATCSLHNILTPRGALVRNALKWAGYLTEAIRLYGDQTETVAASHCWPHFGKDEARRYLTLQRDNYKYLHDQTVRMMNKGMTAPEIAETLTPPEALAGEWFTRGYYGTYSHNSKAIYQRYLGWYDAVPANLNPHIPTKRAALYVAAMGGAAKVIKRAKAAMASGDYRWSSDLLNQLIFADPANKTARALLADSYEQQGYQAEASTWRNMYLSAARDLRAGVKPAGGTASLDVVSAIPTDMLLDSIATRLDPAIIGDRKASFSFIFTDRSEAAAVSISNAVMVSEMGVTPSSPTATLTGARQLFLGLFFLKLPLAQLESAGLAVEGDKSAIIALQAAIETPPPLFNIAEP
jgi:alkyl sulfatase BDS1-like metallo-beta-lactamase superfamily hydrolase